MTITERAAYIKGLIEADLDNLDSKGFMMED